MNSFLIPSICIFSLFLATAGWGAVVVSLGSKGVPWAAPSHWGQLRAVFISGQNASANVTSDSYHKQLGFRLWSLTSKATHGNTRLSEIMSNARCFKKRGRSLSLSLQSQLAHKVQTGLQGPACVVLSLSAIFPHYSFSISWLPRCVRRRTFCACSPYWRLPRHSCSIPKLIASSSPGYKYHSKDRFCGWSPLTTSEESGFSFN